jgi:Ca2+-binding RTX toxin-like protein
VTNTNQIEVFTQGSESLVTINLSGGPFVPGATPDPGSSSEIEFTAGGNGSVNLIGGPGADRFRYMSAQGQIGLNLNAGPDDEDLDLVLLPDQDTNFTASGGPGADTIDVVGHPQVFVAAAGNRGNDTLSSRGSAVRFSALEGNAGRDRIIGGRSNDLIAPGAGPDIVEAGSGPDQIFLRHDKRRDRVDCGPGRDRVFGVLSTVVDPLDHLRSCERVKGR